MIKKLFLAIAFWGGGLFSPLMAQENIPMQIINDHHGDSFIQDSPSERSFRDKSDLSNKQQIYRLYAVFVLLSIF